MSTFVSLLAKALPFVVCVAVFVVGYHTGRQNVIQKTNGVIADIESGPTNTFTKCLHEGWLLEARARASSGGASSGSWIFEPATPARSN